MDVKARLLEAGFDRVFVLDGTSCGIAEKTLLLAVKCYQAEASPAREEAWIHPYYFASQSAYLAARALVQEAEREGVPLSLRDEVRVKPLFARMPGVSQGRNTLSYLPGTGSRFHVQIFVLDEPMEPDPPLEDAPHPTHCGNCDLCMKACPTGAIDEQGFHREKCLRNWQMSGKPVPEELRALMGNRLIGCDDCQRCCPHNPAPDGQAHEPVSIDALLTDTKAACASLREKIGANLALPNRVLAQACLIAGCSGNAARMETLLALCHHPSPVVAETAAWAVAQLKQSAEAKNL